MKNLSVLIVFIFTITLHSQTKEEITKDPYEAFFNPSSRIQGLDQDALLIAEKTKNAFFAQKMGDQAFNSYDVNFKLFDLFIDPKDGSYYVGGKTTFDYDGVNEIKNVFKYGLKAKAKDGFATYFAKDIPQSSFGANFQFSLNINRDLVIKEPENVEALKKYKQAYENNLANNLDGIDYSSMPSKAFEKFEELAEDEAKAIDYLGAFERSWAFWIFTEFYLPIGEKKYSIISDINNSTVEKTDSFRPFEINFGATYFNLNNSNPRNRKYFYLTPIVGVKNNNNIELEKLTKYSLQTFNENNSNLLVKSDDVYEDNYETFISTTIQLEAVYLFLLNGRFGLSGSISRRFDDYGATNWKIGIPFNLDIYKMDKINFELALREVNGNSYVGVNLGFLFGNYIK
jgi:hypothetical protein